MKFNVILDVFVREMQAVRWCVMERCMGWCLGVKAVACQATLLSTSKCAISSTGSKMSLQQTLRVSLCIPSAFGPRHTLYFIVNLALFFTHVSSSMTLGVLCCLFLFPFTHQKNDLVELGNMNKKYPCSNSDFHLLFKKNIYIYQTPNWL